METKQTAAAGNFWWLKTTSSAHNSSVGNQSDRELLSSSLAEYLENEQRAEENDDDEEVDIPSILEEISRLSAKSPLGQYQKDIGQLSIDEILQEAEKLYIESSKSFEQLSTWSKTSHNLSDLSNEKTNSTPTPKSLSPLPLDDQKSESESDTESLKAMPIENSRNYSMEFESGTRSKDDETIVSNNNKSNDVLSLELTFDSGRNGRIEDESEDFDVSHSEVVAEYNDDAQQCDRDAIAITHQQINNQLTEIEKKDGVIKMLLTDNKGLKDEMRNILHELNDLKIQQRTIKSAELGKALEELKDTQEQKNALQLQLAVANKSNLELRTSYDELLTANNILERRVVDLDSVLLKYKSDLKAIQSIRDKLKENEFNVNKLLEQERSQGKTLKQQIEKDAKCILDLNRQIKEMERIIARKHPDSVSALIVASKYEDSNARKMFEERIKSLEQEALIRDTQNSKVFKDVQEKFNQMKLKYENHIEDLELHVNDLKSQLKRRGDTYDVYTQTVQYIDEKIPAKDTTTTDSQTDLMVVPFVSKKNKADSKEDTHLVATIRGYQAELNSKEKLIAKLQKDGEELRKTNRRLQKEREGSLRSILSEKKSVETKGVTSQDACEDIETLRTERDQMKAQLSRIEGDYQALKAKRLQDLNTLQEAHEREMSNYLANVTPLREKLEVNTVALSALQKQLAVTKEQLTVITVERDHLNNKLNSGIASMFQDCNFENGNSHDTVELNKKLNLLEGKFEERENRLRAIVHGLAQKAITNRTCEQCEERQQQLIGYKVELDQIIATLRCLKEC